MSIVSIAKFVISEVCFRTKLESICVCGSWSNMKKVILTKSNSKTLKITSPDNAKSKLAYAELFRVVLQIPEKDVQLRILEAVNGKSSTAQIVHALCPNCKKTFGNSTDSFKEKATQTDITEEVTHSANQAIKIITLPLKTSQNTLHSSHGDGSQERNSPALQRNVISTTVTRNHTIVQQSVESKSSGDQLSKINDLTDAPVKRKRKRKVCLPQVVKKSHAQMAHTQLQPKLKARKIEKSQDINQAAANELNRRSRSDSIISISSDILNDIIFDSPEPHKTKEEHIMRKMAEEFIDADIRTDGLLAIHRTIVENDLDALRRQIFVWKKIRKVEDLNTLLTDDDENCLQLAIVQDCFPKIINVLINEGLNTNEIDDHSNTCIHLAVLNEIDDKSLRLLMEKIDLKLLLHLNDDGYTPLHMVVRTNSYNRAEIILNTLDERLSGIASFTRDFSAKSSENEFSKYYEDVCKKLEQKYGNTTRNAQPKLKKKFLEMGDRKSGNTALFFAIENKLEHFVFFLLAHLTDPRVMNFSGQDAKSYYAEFGKMLKLSLKVDNAMESVVTILG
uniref:Nuclear factor NF-kappa-B p110 subunit n=2 Tax=Bactrocera dorsalis TaxID=27457 RepID=A0A034WBW0_BACDO